jgi:hypothetical protein
MPSRALRLLRIAISNRVHSAAVAKVKKVRLAAIRQTDPALPDYFISVRVQ